MTWREELRRVTLPDGRRLIGASFRGVPFLVTSADRAGGRRIVNHEFPRRDDNFVDDLGRHTRVFRFEGYVIGDDYLGQRDELLSALEDTAGPGQLVHPYYGTKRAICSGLSVRETIVDGGMAVFSIEMMEAPAQAVAPVVEVDPAGVLSASADVANAAARGELVESYSAAGLPAYAVASAEAAVKAVTASLSAELGPVVRDTQELAALTDQIHRLTAEASALVRTPGDLFDRLGETLSALATTVASAPGAVLDALLRSYATALPSLAVATTVTRQRERANQLALATALRQVLAIAAARLAPSVPFVSVDEASSARNAIIAALDAEASSAGDAAYPALIQLRADVVNAVPGDVDLARVVPVTRTVAIPSLLLAYQLYGSVDAELDVVARNNIRNPAFVAGTLSVLSSG